MVALRNGRLPAQEPEAPPARHGLVAYDAERSVVAALLCSAEAFEVVAGLSPNDIEDTFHRAVFSAARELHVPGEHADAVLVGEKIAPLFGQSDGAASLDILNAAQAPWTLESLPRQCERIANAARNRRIQHRARLLAEAVGVDGDDADELLELYGFEDRHGDPDRRSPVRLLGSREFDDAEMDVEPLIDGLLMKAKPAIGGGPAKACKTLLETSIVIHGGTGTNVWGWPEFTVPRPFRSAFVSMESGGATIRANARSICHSLGYRLSDLDGTVFWGLESLKLSDPSTLTALRREIERRELSYVVVDPLYLAIDLDADDAKSVYAMGKRLGEIGKVIDDTGATIKLLHHGIKRPQEPLRPMRLVDLSGAGVQEWPGQWGLYSRRDEYNEENRGHHELWGRFGGRDFGGSLLAIDIDEFSPCGEHREWRVAVRPASEAASEIVETTEAKKHAKRAAERDAFNAASVKRYAPKVVALLRRKAHRAGASESKIRNLCGVSQTAWPPVLASLLGSDEIEECTFLATNGQEYAGYRLKGSGHSDSLGLHPDSPNASESSADHDTHTDSLPYGESPSECVRRKRGSKRKRGAK